MNLADTAKRYGRILGFGVLACYPTAGLAATIDYNNCQQNWSIKQMPQRIVAMNQSAADMLLALQVGDRLVGVSYLDDAPEALKQGNYHGIKVISRQYPGAEILYANKVDFLVASYISAFHSEAGDRAQLQKNGIGSYLLYDGCQRSQSVTLSDVMTDIRTLGKLTDRQKQAEQLIQRIEQRQQQVRKLPALSHMPTVFYYDGGQQDMYTQGADGFISNLLADAGAKNLFASERQKWLHVSPEKVIHDQPDIILLSDDLRMSAQRKIVFMQADPVLSTLHAVQQQRFIIISFSDLYPGVNSGETLWTLAQQIRQLMN